TRPQRTGTGGRARRCFRQAGYHRPRWYLIRPSFSKRRSDGRIRGARSNVRRPGSARVIRTHSQSRSARKAGPPPVPFLVSLIAASAERVPLDFVATVHIMISVDNRSRKIGGDCSDCPGPAGSATITPRRAHGVYATRRGASMARRKRKVG